MHIFSFISYSLQQFDSKRATIVAPLIMFTGEKLNNTFYFKKVKSMNSFVED